MVLKPLDHSLESDEQKKKKFIFLLHHNVYIKDMSFEFVLIYLGLSKDHYILLLYSSLLCPIVLLKINPCDNWINSFSKHVPTLWYANTNAQFILDSYAIGTYCSSYMTKMDHTMTSAFKKIREDSL